MEERKWSFFWWMVSFALLVSVVMLVCESKPPPAWADGGCVATWEDEYTFSGVPVLKGCETGLKIDYSESDFSESAQKVAKSAEIDVDLVTLTHDAVNAARTSEGLPALGWNERMRSLAQAHADDLAAHSIMGHTGSDGLGFADRYYAWKDANGGVSCGQAGENVAVRTAGDDSSTAQGFADQWMASPGHRANILRGEYGGAAMGIAEGERWGLPAVWAVQVFCGVTRW